MDSKRYVEGFNAGYREGYDDAEKLEAEVHIPDDINYAQLERVAQDINKRMAAYHSSMEPTSDEITIAWLLTVIADLKKELKSKP